ncbi:MAG: hypothetical protein K2I11_03375 [Bacteroides sp.]|nr:hypothetical protein [Bacteroides sp.]
MIMMKTILLYIIGALACLLPAVAQQPDARTILDRTAEAFRKSGGVTMAFTIHASGGASMGTIRLKGDKFLLESEDMTTWFDGNTQWSYLASADEVNISEPTAEELQTINPYALLSIYKQGYRLALEKTDASRSNNLYGVRLTATDRRRELQSVVVYMTKDSYRPVRISTTQRGGETAVISIDSYRSGENHPDALFVFDKKKYPTAEIIDLR